MRLKSLFALIFAGSASAAYCQIEKAPPSFTYKDSKAVPIDLETVHVSYDFNLAQKKVNATAILKFTAGESGYPFFDLKPGVSSLELDGLAIDKSLLPSIKTPNNSSTVRILGIKIDGQTEHSLIVNFQLSNNDVTFSTSAVRCGFFMSDLDRAEYGGLHFFETYGPANLEFDQIKFSFDVKVTGTTTAHRIFTNGDVTEVATNQWSVIFPDYYTSSSLYFHIANDKAFAVREGIFQGLDQAIPLQVYSESKAGADKAFKNLKSNLQELEGTFGPSLHKKYVVYATSSFPGGMEHSGATVTDFGALGHEISHSWFARGIMPANGNAGWIDEAIASWRDNGYPSRDISSANSTNLGGFSPYHRATPEEAYDEGADLIAGLNKRYSQFGGMKTVLHDWFSEAKGTNVSTPEFKTFLERSTSDNLDVIFKRAVYGQNRGKESSPSKTGRAPQHPRPFTFEQYKILR